MEVFPDDIVVEARVTRCGDLKGCMLLSWTRNSGEVLEQLNNY
jgi:hypothetical protein